MGYGIGILALIFVGVVFYININECKRHIKFQQSQIDSLCKETGKPQLASTFISPEEKAEIVQLKNSGSRVKAVKKVREMTSMDLVQAKQYVDTL